MRAWLHDSCPPLDGDVPATVTVALDDDCSADDVASGTWTDVSTLPTVVVRVRERTGYDEVGDPVFRWRVLVEDAAVFLHQRTEIDDVSGVTRVVASATVLFAGEDQVTETARVEIAGDQFHVLKVAQYPDRLDFEMERLDGE